MNPIAREMLDILEGRLPYLVDGELTHYGRSRLDGAPGPGSGRYPLGSGEDPNQHRGDLISRVQEMRGKGMSEKEIATAVGYESTTQLRSAYSNAINERRATQIASARAMLADGKNQAQVARELGINESTLRSLLNERAEARTNAAKETADFLRQQIDEKGMIDVGVGVELELGISREKLNQALSMLEADGYLLYGGGVPQVTNPGKQTNIKVICPPGTEHRDIYDFENVHTITDYKQRIDEDGTERIERGFEYPASMDSSRLMIRYRDDAAPDGHTGVEKDGTIEIRRGVADLDLGESHYAQVRILVDGDKYLKGMALYSDDMPDGVDVIFNTNKTHEQADKVLKTVKDDPANPFGALLREEGGQYHYIDPETGERKLGLINKTRTEGDWGEWADALPSQFLGKQSMKLIQQQLSMSIADKQAEYDDILALTNPTVKKQLLETFANDCDSAAEHLQAAALPRQKYQVILPISTMKDNEVYAPNYQDGETVALIRYPHGGTFEIPILTVNNRQPDGRRILGNTPADAIGINSKVAERLSGADFDGDTVMVIPCNSSKSTVRITSTPPLKELEGFDPKMDYGYSRVETDQKGDKHYYRDGHEFKVMKNTQMEMGKISNLITDMTLKGANQEELARAVKHSMVVIDAEKHKLDWKQSEIDNGIAALRKRYQERVDEDGKVHNGASTLLSRAKSPVQVTKRKGTPKINPETGELEYKTVEETYTDKKGKTRIRTQDSTQMAETRDARRLSSGTPQEEAYADYANRMKAMANAARKEILSAGKIQYSASAKQAYSEEVGDLERQLKKALMNAPRERQAQLAANSEVKAMRKANPDMTGKEVKKKGQQALSRNRIRYNAQRHTIDISPRAWQAIQAGAISENLLTKILRFADQDQVRSYATPRARNTLSAGKQARIRAMRASGYTTSQIAEALGVSASTVSRYIAGKE
jgi:DNA-binding CsgD family transcriptional regulator